MHVQLYPLASVLHVPLFWHGFDEHGSIGSDLAKLAIIIATNNIKNLSDLKIIINLFYNNFIKEFVKKCNFSLFKKIKLKFTIF